MGFRLELSDLEVQVDTLTSGNIAPVHVVGVFEDRGKISRGLPEQVAAKLESEAAKYDRANLGKAGSATTLRLDRNNVIIAVGLGNPEEWKQGITGESPYSLLERVRNAAGNGVKEAVALDGASPVSFSPLGKVGLFNNVGLLCAQLEGMTLAGYAGHRVFQDAAKDPKVSGLQLLLKNKLSYEEGEQVAGVQSVVEAENLARRLIELPHNIVGPNYLAEAVWKVVIGHKDRLSVIEHVERNTLVEAQNSPYAALGAVSRASPEAHFLRVRYTGNEKTTKRIALILKGLTYDTGGLYAKPAPSMAEMDGDMGGAGTGIGVMQSLAMLNSPLNVDFYFCLTTNNLGETAYKPGEPISLGKDAKGKFLGPLWIQHTDAEGRVAMATAAAHIACDESTERDVALVGSISTLTGAMIVATGAFYSGGIIANQYESGVLPMFTDALVQSGEQSAQYFMPFQTLPGMAKRIQDSRGGIANVGPGMWGKAFDGHLFERALVPSGIGYAHMDIAPMLEKPGNRSYADTRFDIPPVRAIVGALEAIAERIT